MPHATLPGPALPGASDDLRALAARGVPHRYRKGRLLIEEGDTGGALYIVLHGRLRVFSASAESGREITYGTYGPGEYVGEMSLDGGPRSASVETLETSDCMLVAQPTLEAFIAERPSFAFELLAKVIRRARAATLSTRQLALNDVYGRLRLTLESLAAAQPDGSRRLTEHLTHKALAHRIGCSREMVSRLMKDLEQGGYVGTDAGRAGGAGGSSDARWVLRRPLPQRW